MSGLESFAGNFKYPVSLPAHVRLCNMDSDLHKHTKPTCPELSSGFLGNVDSLDKIRT